jgi:hypothetical protein
LQTRALKSQPLPGGYGRSYGDRIVLSRRSRHNTGGNTHKFGILLPKLVAQALRIDEETGTTFWKDAIHKEMKCVLPAFEFKDGDMSPVAHTKIDCHMIFDIKMDLTRKARLVAGGHQTNPPKDMVYFSVVARDSVRLGLLITALNDLDILAAKVQGAYLNATTWEKV